ncbi:dienelactone hydrolase family protein [Microscilla marina]|uniref:Dienelactone hydrolase n=1 Tax=Microscilla marina ATCC 23134 TaxID=313606 RepID=A1ZZQ8_MICM2|nr:dienelactone hydrolase family protein [Microscilla marina]EAY24116.1 dienelactone hydrolase [Microscilla marina ATCC 23134]
MQQYTKLVKVLLVTGILATVTAFTLINIRPAEAPKNKFTCCHSNESDAAYAAIEEFADLTYDPSFVASHEMPIAWQGYMPEGKMIEFATTDGKKSKAYVNMASGKSPRYLLVIHEWWGLNKNVKKEADQLFKDLKKQGVNVVALDLYDGKVATTRKDAGKYMRNTQTARAEAIIKGALAMANKATGNKAKIGTIGWCFGGGWSLQASILAGKQAAACVMYYGMPEKNVARLKLLKTDVLGIFAKKDRWITPKIVNTFETKMKSIDKSVRIHQYDAAHAFANPSSPRYEKKAAKDAYKKTLKFLKKRL